MVTFDSHRQEITFAKDYTSQAMKFVKTAILFFSTLFISPIRAFSPTPAKGIEVRVCHDRDCLTDGAVNAKKLVENLAKSGKSKGPVTVTKCGCLGPCGKGPSADVKIDGIKVKDNRGGQSNYCFLGINSAESAAYMLERAGVEVSDKAIEIASKKAEPVVSTRKFLDFDRTTRIALQRLLYVTVALPLIDADKNGTWDQINGVLYPNSYGALIAIVFIASQFMGTGSKANSTEESGENV